MQERRKVVGLDYGVYNAALPQTRPQPKKDRKIKKNDQISYENDAKNLFKYFTAVVLCLVVLLGQGVYINNQGLEIGSLSSNLDNFKLENNKKIIAISNLSSLENVEKVAINDYNMVRAENVHYLIR